MRFQKILVNKKLKRLIPDLLFILYTKTTHFRHKEYFLNNFPRFFIKTSIFNFLKGLPSY